MKQSCHKTFTWKYQTMLLFLCSHSYLFTFLLSSQFYRHICLKSTAYFFDPRCTVDAEWLLKQVLWHRRRLPNDTHCCNYVEQVTFSLFTYCHRFVVICSIFGNKLQYLGRTQWKHAKKLTGSSQTDKIKDTTIFNQNSKELIFPLKFPSNFFIININIKLTKHKYLKYVN